MNRLVFLFPFLFSTPVYAHSLPLEKAVEDLRRSMDPLDFGKTMCLDIPGISEDRSGDEMIIDYLKKKYQLENLKDRFKHFVAGEDNSSQVWEAIPLEEKASSAGALRIVFVKDEILKPHFKSDNPVLQYSNGGNVALPDEVIKTYSLLANYYFEIVLHSRGANTTYIDRSNTNNCGKPSPYLIFESDSSNKVCGFELNPCLLVD